MQYYDASHFKLSTQKLATGDVTNNVQSNLDLVTSKIVAKLDLVAILLLTDFLLSKLQYK